MSLFAFIFTALVLAMGTAQAQSPADDGGRRAIAIEALSRLKGVDLDQNPAVKAAVIRVVESTRGTAQFVELVRDFKIKGQGTNLLDFAASHPAESAAAEAVRLALAEDTEFKLVKAGLSSTNALGLTEALGNAGEKALAPIIEEVLQDGSREIAVRRAAVRALTQTQDGARFLLQQAREGKLPVELKVVASAELNRSPWTAIKEEAARVLPVLAAGTTSELPPVAELLKRTGDPVNGAKVFLRQEVGCSNCHQVNGKGTDFGPNLSEIGTKLGKDAIYVSILEPSAGISFGFEAWSIELKNGDETFGLITSDAGDEISVKTQNGIISRYKKSDVAKREKSNLSIMPNGLKDTMSAQELVDLVEYLSTLKKVAGR